MQRCNFHFLKINEIKKKIVEVRIIKGPEGRLVNLKSKIPRKAESAPKNMLKKLYWNKFLLKFLEVEAGMATSAAVKRPPTIFTPKATKIAMEKRYKRLYFLTSIFSAFAKSSEMLIKSIFE